MSGDKRLVPAAVTTGLAATLAVGAVVAGSGLLAVAAGFATTASALYWGLYAAAAARSSR